MNIITVSLCMIARNEEQSIRQCLRSVTHLVHETIVVDTGSSDRTIAIAKAEGAKVFQFPWGGDFAAARNFALAQASGDWILVLDADEVLEAVSQADFTCLLNLPDVEGYYLKILSVLGTGTETTEDYVVRLFRHKDAYRFQGTIHEQVIGSIQAENNGRGIAFSPLTIIHFGYLDTKIKAKSKRHRNIAVIRRALRSEPQNPFLLYSLGIEYLQSSRIHLACRQLERALKQLHGHEGYLRNVITSLAICLYKIGDLPKLTRLVEDCLRMLPADADLYTLQGMALLAAENYSEAITAFEKALDGSGELLSPNWLHALLGDAYNLSGFYPRAGKEYIQALQINPRALYPLTQLLGLRQSGRISLDWLALGALALPDSLLPASHDGEDALSLLLILLKMLRYCSAGQYTQLPGLYPHVAAALQACDGSPRFITDYFKLWEAEITARLEAAARLNGCGLFSPLPEISGLVIFSLELVVATLCPSWSPALSETGQNNASQIRAAVKIVRARQRDE